VVPEEPDLSPAQRSLSPQAWFTPRAL